MSVTPPLGSHEVATSVDTSTQEPQCQADAPSSAQAAAEQSPARTMPQELLAKFANFDHRDVYDSVISYAQMREARNIVVEFGDDKARVAYDLTDDHFKMLLSQPSEPWDVNTPIRWINVWNPSAQRDIIETIGNHYRFSKRLIMSIWAWDLFKNKLRRKHASKKHDNTISGVALKGPDDLETGRKAQKTDVGKVNNDGSSAEDDSGIFVPENLATFKTMQHNLNYTSIDKEEQFTCIGANWLYRRPASEKRRPSGLVPPKHWSWYALCAHIISIHEAEHYSNIPESMEEEELRSMRTNTLKVLRQLSLCGFYTEQHKFTQMTSIRQPGSPSFLTSGEKDEHVIEGSSNLFYYLFEDYSASFDILDSFKSALDAVVGVFIPLAINMIISNHVKFIRAAEFFELQEDTADIIPTLYTLKRDLRQLKNLFSTYKTLIDRLLSTDIQTPEDKEVAKEMDGWDSSEKLSKKAVTRFRRLQVQLQSMMLDTITDTLDEIKSLEDTYFSLIAQKDSHSTERLTRSATLLAKLSVFFLPISFMTSYFSTSIPQMNDNYSMQTYWAAFAVIASVSFISLFFFSKVLMFLSEILDHWVDGVVHWIAGKTTWRMSSDDDL